MLGGVQLPALLRTHSLSVLAGAAVLLMHTGLCTPCSCLLMIPA